MNDQLAGASTVAAMRHDTLDIIRGIAVMGILAMNIVGFAMPEQAYMNPRAYGWEGPADYWAWAFNFVLIDGKMRGLFSFLFGASMLLVIESAVANGKSGGRIHYARMFWLFLFGVAHIVLLWWGDILNHYALIGSIAFLFRRKSPRSLVIIGLVFLVISQLLISLLPVSYVFAEAAAKAPGASKEAVEGFKGFAEGFGVPDAATLAKDMALHRGDWAGLIAHRIGELPGAVIGAFVLYGTETLAYMLFGMAGLKSGMLKGEWSRGAYVRWMLVGFGLGVPAMVAIAWWMTQQDFSPYSVIVGALVAPSPIRPLMIMAWASLIVLTIRPGTALGLRVAAAGRAAFTNYLGTSIICSTLFYGYGLGLYGQLSRAELYIPVISVWVVILIWSKPWLGSFRYGPLEWLWRSLARGRPQSIRGAAVSG